MNKIEISGSFSPAILNVIAGTYVVSGSNWIQVPDDTKLEDVIWVNDALHDVQNIGNIHIVRSSDGKSEYEVQMVKGTPTCTCKGFQFNKFCRHISEVFPYLS